jgi:iron complex outermembrane recepter protein
LSAIPVDSELTIAASRPVHSGLLAAFACLASAVGFVPSAARAAAEATAQLDEVVVTSRKREENLQDVPVSIQAVTSSELQMRSLDTLNDVGQHTTNLNFGQQAQSGSSANTVYIRGVGQSDTLAAFDPGVGIYMDGVYLGRMTALDLDLTNIERVEVLRGPQGTLFGKNTNGGAISIVTQKPNIHADRPEGRVQLTTGSHSRFDAIASVDIPVVNDVAALQASFARRKQDGFSNRIDGQEQANTDRYLGRLALLVKPTESLELLLAADGSTYNQATSAYRLVQVRTASPVPTLYALFTPYRYDDRWVTGNPYFYDGTGPNQDDGKVWGTSLTVTWTADWATLKSITAFRGSSIDNSVDADGSPLTVLSEFEIIRQHQFSQEFQLAGAAFSDRLKWVTGLYYFKESAIDNNSFNGAVEFFQGAADFSQDLTITNRSYAAYGQATYALTDALNLTVGARGTSEKKQVGRVQTAQVPIAPDGSWTSFLPRVGLDYHFTKRVMGYVSAAEGEKSGGFNGRAASVAEFNRFDPEKVWTYEVGMRSDLLDERVRFNGTVFYSRYTDMQVQLNKSVTDPATGRPVPFTVVGNIPSADIRGAEAELTVIPVERLKVIAGVGITDGRYKELLAGAPMTLQDRFINAPHTSIDGAVEYTAPITSDYTATGRVDYIQKSRIEYDYGNSPLVSQPAYSLVNARLRFDATRLGVSVSVFGTNLTNKVYAVGGHDDGPQGSLGFVLQQMAPPRQWGVSAEYRF